MGNQTKLNGKWQIESAFLTINGEKISTVDSSRVMMKIFTDTHFAFFSKELIRDKFEKAEPSTSEQLKAYRTFDAGGGRYKIEGSKYTEFVEYCTHPNYEGEEITFDIMISDGKLVQQGIYPLVKLGLGSEDGYMIETYNFIE